MNRKPKVAIIGRPNVGKSALFNRICKKRLAIVDEAEGITRDRLYSEGELFGRSFITIDTGGINPRSDAEFNALIIQQAEIAIEEADSLILVVDSQVGVTLLDEEVANLLHQSKKPLTLAINKVDSPEKESLMHDFYSLGIASMVPVSAAQNWQIAELMLAALQPVPESEENIHEEDIGISIAIVGRPNVGKSSLLNTLLDEERAMVSPIAGTTRDSIDVTIERDHFRYTLIDTAGIRKKAKESEVVDKFAAIRTERAIERADICLLLIDAQKGITTQEKRIARTIEQAGKGCILLFNKWDLVKGFRMEHCLKLVEDELPFLRYCPKLMISATSARNIEKIFPLIQEVNTAYNTRITTHQLNVCIEKAMQKVNPPMIRGKRLRVYYLAQVDICPPRFVLFINHLELMSAPYEKYLYNQLRIAYPFIGSPLKIFLKKKKERTFKN